MSASMDASLVRKRRKDLGGSLENGRTPRPESQCDNAKKPALNSLHAWTLICIFYCALYVLIRYRSFSFPEPKLYHPGFPNDTFYESNAEVHLKQFTSHGPRVVGSIANEEIAYGYILNEVKMLQKNVVSPMEIEVDEQLTSGSFDITFLSDYVSVYKNIKNVVAKLKGSKHGSKHSVLMSCHFDSATNSPGAGDNAISCSVMLEIIRVISQSTFPLKHDIIFLFNGAEENLLQASHGFITQHPWAKSIEAFVNVDSAGAGGWEFVFQTGPSHPWLVRMYSESIPYPSGSILGQEIFQSGLIPSDTDFRIFRDFGNIPGLDIAYISNGYVYHTRNDQARFIEPGCVQRSGENLVALLLKLSNSDSLAHPGEEKEGTVIFFDIVGYVMVRYSEKVAIALNSALVAAILFKIIRKTFHLDKSEPQDVKYFKNLTTSILYITMSWVVIFATCVAMAMVVTVFRRNMSWFTHISNVLPIFILPSFVALFLLHEFFKRSPLKSQSGLYSEQMFFDGNLVIWCLVTLYLTVMGIGSAFFPMLYVIGPLAIRESIVTVFKTFTWRNNPYSMLAVHLTSLFIPSVYTMYIGHASLWFFIPIMGRSGTEVNPDIAIGSLVAALIIMASGYLIGICYICDNMRRLIGFLCGIICIWLGLILFTPLGFPFSGDYHWPTSERITSFHIERRFHDIQGSISSEDSGIWLLPFDNTKYQHLIDAVPELRNASRIECTTGPYCNLPYLIPVISLLHPKESLYLPTGKHNKPGLSFKLLNTHQDGMGLTKMTFEVTGGPDHMTVFIQPKEGVSLEVWSLSPLKPEPAAMPPDIDELSYFVYYSYGTRPDNPWVFSLHLKVPETRSTKTSVVDIGVSGHSLHGEHQMSEELMAFESRVPDWATLLTWTITYDRYTF